MAKRRGDIVELTLREAAAPPSAVDLGLTTRTFSVRAGSADDQTRSVAATVATESAVTVRDPESWQIIDEVLRMDGAVLPERVPLLNNHYRYSLDDVLGSAREIKVTGGQLDARLYFAAGDEICERAWNKAKQGHLADVSAGYRTLEFTDIPPGQTRTVGGRAYTAGGFVGSEFGMSNGENEIVDTSSPRARSITATSFPRSNGSASPLRFGL